MATVLAVPSVPIEVAGQALAEGNFLALLGAGGRPLDALPRIRGEADGGLFGRVDLVLGADRASRFVAPAIVDGEPRLFLLDASADGVRVVPRALLDGSRSVADVVLDGALGVALRVDAVTLLAQAALRSAVLVAADSLGAMERMLDLAVEYSKQRQQFGVPIGSFQAVKHAAATMLVAIESARSIVYFAAASVEEGHPERHLHAATAKAQVTGPGAVVADSALTLHGAIGYTWEHELHLHYKRAKLDQQLFGPPTIWNERIAAALPLLPAAG